MPDTEEIDGDVYVSPRHLASTTGTGDPALAPLLDLGWDLRYDEESIMWNQVCQGSMGKFQSEVAGRGPWCVRGVGAQAGRRSERLGVIIRQAARWVGED
ncbi:hypothetical protein AB0D38_03195 [Streptomyces sp. NPDC048279]|uniref:hypothetical protein n=1 Tax=Streptomyces sp. NPDC048279 TaxID=3154714 RepID=UPI003449B13F